MNFTLDERPFVFLKLTLGKTVPLGAFLLFGTGCAADPARVASGLPSPTLCYINWAGNQSDKLHTSKELAARGFTCNEEAVRMGAEDFRLRQQQAATDEAQRRALAGEMAMRLLVPPAPIRCTTQYAGRVAYTDCR